MTDFFDGLRGDVACLPESGPLTCLTTGSDDLG